MLQTEGARCLAGGDVIAEIHDGDNLTGDTQKPELRQSEEGNPFNFRPQLIHLHKDHELFEVTQQQQQPRLTVTAFHFSALE